VRRTTLEAVQRIVGRAVTDADFREALKTHPDSVFANRDVTPEEQEALKAMDWDSIGSVGTELEQRVSRMGFARAGCH
jgi:Ribosomally synthesized peptide prototyped by Frankia Franean1_4349.